MSPVARVRDHGGAGRLQAAPPAGLTALSARQRPLPLIATDGGFRPDGTFVAWPAHDTAALTEAFRRAVLQLFVRRGLFEE